jgi:hypothetical protein
LDHCYVVGVVFTIRAAGATIAGAGAITVAGPSHQAPLGEAGVCKSDESQAHHVGRFLSSARFWQLMARWGVSDAEALDLIGFAGKPRKSGKRPRFRFSPHQKRLTSYLIEIDTALGNADLDAGWLAGSNRSAPFSGQSPLVFMTREGIDGVAAVLRVLTRAVLRSALKRQLAKNRRAA